MAFLPKHLHFYVNKFAPVCGSISSLFLHFSSERAAEEEEAVVAVVEEAVEEEEEEKDEDPARPLVAPETITIGATIAAMTEDMTAMMIGNITSLTGN